MTNTGSAARQGSQLVWFKRDLRVVDHEPLARAVASGPVLALFVYEPSMWRQPTADARHLDFINESLGELENALSELGVDLAYRTGEVVEVLGALQAVAPVETIWAHQETTDLAGYQRDLDVAAWAQQNGTRFIELQGRGVVRGANDHAGWSNKWQEYMDRPTLAAPSSATGLPFDDCGSRATAPDLGLAASTCVGAQRGGRSAGLEVLSSFLEHRAEPYVTAMSSPVTAFDHSSRLSPYLAHGCLSARECYQANDTRRAEISSWYAPGSWLKSLNAFESRLHWRDHFTQTLENQPSLEIRALHPMFESIRPDFDQENFEAFATGNTGFPMVDACMRATTATGWLNFRMRAMLVSFATYHLWLDWRPIAELFARLWIDYEPGIHYPQHQMQAGVTGSTTIRMYSPVKQVHDQDPTGLFVKEWVPELAGVDPAHIAEPALMSPMEQQWTNCVIGEGYPAPIVDHMTAYHAAQTRIRAIHDLPETKRLARQANERQESRRRPTEQQS